MDPQTVDQNYARLQQQEQQTAALIPMLIVTGAGFGIGDDIINKIF